MKFYEVLESVTAEEVRKVFKTLYPEYDAEEHVEIFEGLRNLRPVMSERPTRIVLSTYYDGDGHEMSVDGYDGRTTRDIYIEDEVDFDPDQEGLDEECCIGLGLSPWAEWLGFDVDEDTLRNFLRVDIVCHCLWEMSFYGNSDENIQEARVKLESIAERIRNTPREELLASGKFLEVDEMFERLKERLNNNGV